LAGYDGIVEITEDISPDERLTSLAKKHSPSPVLFRNAAGGRLVTNLYADRSFVSRSLGTDVAGLLPLISQAIGNPADPEMVDVAPFTANMMDEPDLSKLPIPRFYRNDGGPYMTASVFSAGGLDDGNISYHRVMVTGKDRGTVRLVERDLYGMYRSSLDTKNGLQVAISIGVPPEVAIAAAVSVGPGANEYRIASALSRLRDNSPLRLFRLDNGCIVPAGSEYVLQGRLTRETGPEGPFVDITGTYDIERQQPVLLVDRIYHRDEPLFHAIVPGWHEHFLLMGMPKEAGMLEHLSEAGFDVMAVTLTEGGCSWLHGVVSIRKREADDGIRAGEEALAAHRSMKRVVVVDDDIDVHSPSQGEWALATRFQADRDIKLLPGQRGSSLDPSSIDGSTTKMILDATMPLSGNEGFRRVLR